jgi:hypothetical protein
MNTRGKAFVTLNSSLHWESPKIGTGFLFRIPHYEEIGPKVEHYGIISCTQVMPNIYKIEDFSKYKYRFKFEGVEYRFDEKPELIAKIHRTPHDADKSKRLNVTFLEFNTEAFQNDSAS